MVLTMGMLDTTEGGALWKTTEKRKMRKANTKAFRKRAVQMAAAASKDGLASSRVFTPVQGLELVNPEARKECVQEVNRKWFSEDAGFTSALPSSILMKVGE
jgi:U4/U6 small nuclear ribonucleoprotein PRP31